MKLEINNLTKRYDNNWVLEDINATFNVGKIYALIGRNGSGKTTFFNCLNKDVDYEEGTINIILDKSRKLDIDDIGYVVSTPVVPEFLTGKEFIEIFIDINKEKIEDLKDIDYYFSLISLNKDDQNKLMCDYSHGMKNKIQLLINIILKPKVILLDEPLTSLDIVAQEEMKLLLQELKKDCILIFSTHILELALSLCDEIVVLNNRKFTIFDKKINKTTKDKIINILKDEKNV